MPYNYTQAGNTMAIAEQQYGSDNEIRFTTFTSCIGLIAREGGDVTGVHLVMFASDDTPFDIAAADAAIALLGNYSEVVVIGQTQMWEDNLPGPYQHLIAGLNNPTIIDMDDGIYGGRVENNLFQTYQNGNYHNV
ncbi:MAG: hypothetical protein L3J28_10760 [Candidatus Polarisedimenticolaceae bacterium]|nr:hypothetical protein [Candidatus Polarisedimenticolaceae bacterium]